MVLFGYTVTKNPTLKTNMKSPKQLGYKYECSVCKCPMFDNEKVCPDCSSVKRKKIL